MVRYAQCCQPVPGDPVVGYVTRGRGVSIHRGDCPNLLFLAHEPERRLEIDWQEAEGERFTVRLVLEAHDRRGLYADLAAAVSATGTDIKSMELHTVDGRVTGSALVEVENLAHLEKIMKSARKVKGVSEVARRERVYRGSLAGARGRYISAVPAAAKAVFDLQSPFAPAGDQPKAIAELVRGLEHGDRFQTLLGVTGSGKTMTVANVIQAVGRPTLVLSHNKTLAAQLYGELKSFFPRNAVEYFISYYDYYQPEAYVPTTDTYIEKDASINEDIDRLRLRATSSLMERDDVIIVSTVSAIYGLGDPVSYRETMVTLERGQRIARDDILRSLVRIQYARNDVAFERGTFRVRGDTVEIFPAYEEQGVRVEMWGDEIERISKINPLTGETITTLDRAAIYPAKHFITTRPTLERAVGLIRAELAERLGELRRENKLLEAQRLESRTNFDIEMMLEIGTCAGIENYSRHLSGRGVRRASGVSLRLFPRGFPRRRSTSRT